VARAKGFRPMTASHKRSRPRKDHAGPVAHPEHPPKVVAFQTSVGMRPFPCEWIRIPRSCSNRRSPIRRISAYKGTHKHGTYSVLLQYFFSTSSVLSRHFPSLPQCFLCNKVLFLGAVGMDLSKVLEQLRRELVHLDAAIVSLERLQAKVGRRGRPPRVRKTRAAPTPARRQARRSPPKK
jgi:hypothetical protein